ncbi:MAG: MFS transporter [Puniceicoccales bacterium]|jgi:FHS family L-fucose permease-like MFS transporter|nr:MFS transporter [Puniceicoccales bacterium]
MSQTNVPPPQSGIPARPDASGTTKVIPPGMLLAFLLVTGLFSLWGFANDITNPMVAAFKDAFLISHFQSSLVQAAFYGGYCVMAIPAALFLRRFSYKHSILVGLGLYVAGCVLFLPASGLASFWCFLFAYFVMTAGLSFLETTANPYILSLGPQETATRRLNFAQAFNPCGSIIGMSVASAFILDKLGDRVDGAARAVGNTALALEKIREIAPSADILKKALGYDAAKASTTLASIVDDAGLGVAQKIAAIYEKVPLEVAPKSEVARRILHDVDPAHVEFLRIQAADLNVIMGPYVVLGVVVAAVFALFFFAKLPGSAPAGAPAGTADAAHHGIRATLGRLFRNGAYWQGVIAQAFYVGVQIMCWTFIIQYAVTEFGMSKAAAQHWNIAAMGCFVSSRFVCTYLLKFVSPGGLLAALSAVAAVLILGVMFFSTGALGAAGGAGINNFTLFDTGLASVGADAVAGTAFLPAGLVCLVLVSACMSLMFPTIYGIALRDLTNEDAKLGSAGLILAIGGGAVFTPLQGWIIDQKDFFANLGFIDSMRASFVVALVCFLVILAYGLRTKFVHHAKG